jgi:hypothetical protein
MKRYYNCPAIYDETDIARTYFEREPVGGSSFPLGPFDVPFAKQPHFTFKVYKEMIKELLEKLSK